MKTKHHMCFACWDMRHGAIEPIRNQAGRFRFVACCFCNSYTSFGIEVTDEPRWIRCAGAHIGELESVVHFP